MSEVVPIQAWTTLVVAEQRLAVGYSYRTRSEEMVLFFHGIGCSRRSFQPIWTEPLFADHSIVCPDFIGFGHTSLPEEGEVDLAMQAELMGGLIEHLKQKRPSLRIHLVAHSMGAAVALLLPPALLAGLASFVNVEGNLIRSDISAGSRQLVGQDYADFKRQFDSGGIYPDFADFLNLKFAKPQAFWSCVRSLIEQTENGSLWQSWNALEIPKRYFYGSLSQNPEVIAQIGPELCQEFVDCGHFLMNEQPSQFYTALSQFHQTIKLG